MSEPSRHHIALVAVADEAPPDAVDIVRDILREVESLPRLMEIYYLAQEPGLLDLLRDLGALADDDRRRLQDYFARHRDRCSRVRELPTGGLILELVDQARSDDGVERVTRIER